MLFLYICIWLSCSTQRCDVGVDGLNKMTTWTKIIPVLSQNIGHSLALSYWIIVEIIVLRSKQKRHSKCLTWRESYFWHVDRCKESNEGWQGTQWLAMWNSGHGRNNGMTTQWLSAWLEGILAMCPESKIWRWNSRLQQSIPWPLGFLFSHVLEQSPDILVRYVR